MNVWELASEISDAKTFAEGSGIRELHRLVDTYGGKNWHKPKGFATIRFSAVGENLLAEAHWYEAHGVGKVELKIKELL